MRDFEMDIFLHARSASILSCRRDRLRIEITTDDRKLEPRQRHPPRLGNQFGVQRGIEIGPTHVAEFLADRAGRDVASQQGRFDRKCARATHEIGERRAAVPAGELQNPGGQHFVQRRLAREHAVAPLVQRIARRIEIDGCPIVVQMEIEPQVGLFEIDARSGAVALAELVDDRVFRQLSGKERMGEERIVDHRIDGQRTARAEMLRPIDLADAGVERLFVVRGERMNGPQHANRGSQPDVCPIEKPTVGLEVDQSPPRLNSFRSERRQFRRQHVFQSKDCLGRQQKFFIVVGRLAHCSAGARGYKD